MNVIVLSTFILTKAALISWVSAPLFSSWMNWGGTNEERLNICFSSRLSIGPFQSFRVADILFCCHLCPQLPECTSWRGTPVRSHGRLSHQWEETLWATCSRCWWDASRNTNRLVSRRSWQDSVQGRDASCRHFYGSVCRWKNGCADWLCSLYKYG